MWALLLSIALASSLDADWHPYLAHYAVYRNGKLIGEMELTLEQQGDRLSIRREGRGIHGMARILRAKDLEYVDGRLHDGRFLPQNYTHHTRVAGIDDLWSASFDWQTGTVDITKGKNILTLDMGPGALDDLSLQLEMQRRLRDNDPDMKFSLVAKDQIKERLFRNLEPEQIETSLGCLRTTPVERGRIGNNHYTKAWLSPEWEFIMLRREDVKTNGDQIELRITKLFIDQQLVKPQPGCVGPVK